jgi:hypothetical protein
MESLHARLETIPFVRPICTVNPTLLALFAGRCITSAFYLLV